MSVFTEKTWIPASILGASVALAFGVGVFVAGLTGRVDAGDKDRAAIRSELQQGQTATQARMIVVEGKIDGIAKDLTEVATTMRQQSIEFVTAQRMRAWRRKLAHDNPTLLIPEWDD